MIEDLLATRGGWCSIRRILRSKGDGSSRRCSRAADARRCFISCACNRRGVLSDWPGGARDRRPVWFAPALSRGDGASFSARLSDGRAGWRVRHRFAPADWRDSAHTHRCSRIRRAVAGVRRYEPGDPPAARSLARDGAHSKVYEPSSVAGLTLLVDFHHDSYDARNEPIRSELAITTAASLASAMCEMGQQIGLVTNARDAADRIRQEGWDFDLRTRDAARGAGEHARNERSVCSRSLSPRARASSNLRGSWKRWPAWS